MMLSPNRHRAAWILAAVAVAVVAIGAMVAHRRSPAPATPSDGLQPSSSSLLVVTWAPALCKVEESASGCRSGRVGKLGQSFVLHGLWPQPRSQQYCDVSKGSRDQVKVSLPPDVQQRLQTMLSDPAVMAKHEWLAHGTCSGVSQAEYFGIATTLAQQAIDVLDPIFDGSVGRGLTARAIRETFDNRFGKGAGSRVGLVCRDVRGEGAVAFEVRLSLPTVVQLRRESPALGDALAAGPAVAPGCGKARVP